MLVVIGCWRDNKTESVGRLLQTTAFPLVVALLLTVKMLLRPQCAVDDGSSLAIARLQ